MLSADSEPDRRNEPFLECGDVLVDRLRLNVFRRGIAHKIEMRDSEFQVLVAMMLQPKRCFSAEELYEAAFDRPTNGDGPMLIHICHLRKAFPGLDIVRTKRNVGYLLGTCES